MAKPIGEPGLIQLAERWVAGPVAAAELYSRDGDPAVAFNVGTVVRVITWLLKRGLRASKRQSMTMLVVVSADRFTLLTAKVNGDTTIAGVEGDWPLSDLLGGVDSELTLHVVLPETFRESRLYPFVQSEAAREIGRRVRAHGRLA